jgi:transcriptional regulator GlxA family with amidase domain
MDDVGVHGLAPARSRRRAARPAGDVPLELARASARAEPTPERVVFQGKVVTAAGVSSGIDMALALVARLAGDDVAQAIQLSIEYDPQPPFDAGSPSKAPPRVVEIVRRSLARVRAAKA